MPILPLDQCSRGVHDDLVHLNRFTDFQLFDPGRLRPSPPCLEPFLQHKNTIKFLSQKPYFQDFQLMVKGRKVFFF
jgi:hypothetical protein